MAIAHESVKCRETDEMWELSPHQKHLNNLHASLKRGFLFIMSKKEMLIITEDYIDEYGLDPSFINKSIFLYKDRIFHIEKHKKDFSSISSYYYSLNNLKTILNKPDFIAEDIKNNSLLFIRQLTDCTLVAVGKINSKELKIKTMYPINETKKIKLKNKSLRNKNK